jgi:hypothetical protein
MTLSLTTKIATTAVAPTPVYTPLQKPSKKRLVAHWVRDENNKLYCRWVNE